jgi:dCTP deaminase
VILSGASIDAAVAAKQIEIDPYDARQLNPASYDLTLGDRVLTYEDDVVGPFSVKQEPTTREHNIDPDFGFWLRRGVGYLMHTRERIRTDHFVPVIDGKSSVGRLFIQVHMTAGYGDPGFNGQYTLEVVSLCRDVRLYAGMRIAQMRFHSVLGGIPLYKGNYTGEAAMGPVASKIWRSFK